MELNSILYALVGLIALFLIVKLFKLSFKILFNGILGVVLLYLTNMLGSAFGLYIPINAVNAIIAGFLGVPGVIFLIVFRLFF